MKFPSAHFNYLHAGQKIKSLEKDFSPAAEQLKEADIILFCYPVYTFLVIYQMRGMMRADHKFFKSHGQYDFPQKRWPTSLKMYLVGWLMSNKKIKSKMGSKLSDSMIAPYKKVLDEA